MRGNGQSGTAHDFFCFNAAGAVWNGAAFVAWSDGDYVSYRIAATQVGTSGRFTATAPAGTASYELRVRDATLADSYVVWAGDGPRETLTVVEDTESALTVDKS